MNLGFDFRQVRSLEGIMAALERMAARINTVWKKQHKADGTHGNITAENVIIEGDLIVDGVPITGGGGAPALHAPTHMAGGTDPIKLDQLAAPTDVTTLNASFAAHGLLRKLPGDGSLFLDGMGGFTLPSGGTPSVHGSTHVPAGSDPIPNAVYRNIANAWTVAQVFPTTTEIRGDYSWLSFWDTTAPADYRSWRILNYHEGNLWVEALNDGGGFIVRYTFGRNGNLAVPGSLVAAQEVQAGSYVRSQHVVATGNMEVSGYIHAGADVAAGTTITAPNYIYSTGAHVVAATNLYALTGGLLEQGRAVQAGHWELVAYVGTNFYGAAPMTWAVEAVDMYGNSFTRIGNTMIWTVYLVNTMIGATLTGALYIALPLGLTGAQSDGGYCELWQSGVGWIPGSVNVEAGNSRVIIAKYDKTPFTVAGLFHLRFTITFRTA